MTSPHFESVRCQNSLSRFSHFIIQTTRKFVGDGDARIQRVMTAESCEDDDPDFDGPLMFSVYGRYDPQRNNQFGGSRSIADFDSLEATQQFVRDLKCPRRSG